MQEHPAGTSSALHRKASGGLGTSSQPSLYWVRLRLTETKNKVSLADGKAGQLWLPGTGR